MKKITTLIFLLSFFLRQVFAQTTWCVPSVVPYGPTTPGITEVKLNTIDRVSPDLESPTSNYELTDQSTTLMRGQTYTISIAHTTDPSICPDMNLRVWIDYNINGDLDDNGETAISMDHHSAGTYTGTFTVPSTASLGETRMRVTAKMSNLGGHTIPTPCNIPPDPIGYHGEVEDYSVVIGANTGIGDVATNDHFISIYPNPAVNNTELSYSLNGNQRVRGELFNDLGQRVAWLFDEVQLSGNKKFKIDLSHCHSGIYLIKLTTGDQVHCSQLMVVNE